LYLAYLDQVAGLAFRAYLQGFHACLANESRVVAKPFGAAKTLQKIIQKVLAGFCRTHILLAVLRIQMNTLAKQR